MKLRKSIFITFGLCMLLIACNTKDCTKLPDKFVTYEDAFEQIENSNFAIEENLNTSKSSWISGASYYSCDGKKGFLFIETDNNTYIYKNVPLSVWNEFKEADSFGEFYHKFLEGYYRLSI